jgi:hypothetical protein
MPRDDDDRPIRRRRGLPVWALALIIAGAVGVPLLCGGGVVLVAIFGRTLPTKPETVYEADDLLASYRKSPVKMGDEFGDRMITVRGKVTGFLGNAVTMGEGPTSITCFLSHTDAAKCGVGQTVKVRGKVSLGNQGGVWLNPAHIDN